MVQPEIALTEPVGRQGAPLLVLGHSLGTGPLIWENVVPLLTERYRVSLVTLPGHGVAPVPTQPFSMLELADAIADAVRGISGGKALYAGVSIGGALALELGLRHSAVFSAVASLASGAFLGGREAWEERAALVRAQSTSVLVSRSAEVWFSPESIECEQVMTGRILRALQETSDEGYARCAEALGGYDLRGELSGIEVPVLALWGELDTVGTEEKQDEIVAGVAHGRKVMIGGIAHQPPAERADATAEALIQFFAEVRP